MLLNIFINCNCFLLYMISFYWNLLYPSRMILTCKTESASCFSVLSKEYNDTIYERSWWGCQSEMREEMFLTPGPQLWYNSSLVTLCSARHITPVPWPLHFVSIKERYKICGPRSDKTGRCHYVISAPSSCILKWYIDTWGRRYTSATQLTVRVNRRPIVSAMLIVQY